MIAKYGAGANEDKSKAFKKAVIANTVRGGENVATGALMGAVLGAECGYSRLPKGLVEGLSTKDRALLDQEVESFVASIPVLAAKI